MKKHIITISREFGSGGRVIGKMAAEKLGIKFYNEDIIAKAAEETGYSKKFIEQTGEYSPLKNMFAYAFVGRDISGASVEDQLYAVQQKIILKLADKEPCVMIGRCADYILKDRTDCLNVFIHGNLKEKTERIQKLYEKTEEQAQKMMKEMDKKRSINYKYYTEQEWGNIKNYTITLNSSEIGYERCVELICRLAEE